PSAGEWGTEVESMQVRPISKDAPATVTYASPEALLAGLQRGDRSAQALFFDRYAHTVETLILRLLGPDSELEDLVQESFFEALRSVHRYRGNAEGLLSWLRAVSVRTAYKRLRRRMVRRRLSLRPTEELVTFPVASDPSTQAALECAQRLIARLPPKESIVFSLRFLEGWE